MAVASVTGAQVAFDTTNLQTLLASTAGIVGAAVVGLVGLAAPAFLQTVSIRKVPLWVALGIGGLLALATPNIILWGLGLFIAGLFTGVAVAGQKFDWGFVSGFVIGPSVGVLLGSVSWRLPGAFALLSALLMLKWPQSAEVRPSMIKSADERRGGRRIRLISSFLVLVASTMIFPAALFYFRNETLLDRDPLPLAIVIAIGGSLGVWRGRRLAQMGLARRSIRQGAWLVILFGVVGSFLTRDTLPDFVGIPFSFLFSLGAARVLASSLSLCESNERPGGGCSTSLVMLGSALAVIPAAIAGNESLFWQLRELKQSYPNTPSLESLDRGTLSLPASFDVARDLRLGSLSGPMRAAATFMTQQHLFLAIAFTAGIAALLAFGASLALPRQRSVRSLEIRLKPVRVDSTSGFAAVKDL
jgi:hypothetical protein